MLKEVEWSSDRSYRTGNDSEPLQYYLDCLTNSNKLDLLLGYFSSAAINVLSLGFAKFLSSGGTIRLIINNVLSENDKQAIESGLQNEIKLNVFDITDFKSIKDILDEYGKHFFECIAWLISNNKITIRIIKPKDSKGISHYKSGVFSDGQTSVGFKASCNFTAFGLLENLEELDAFLLWENARSEKWITGQNRYFENIFNYDADFVEYVDINDIQIAILDQFGDKDLNELIIEEKELLEKKKNHLKNDKLNKLFIKTITKIETEFNQPNFPYISGPRDYQQLAYENWKRNGYQGIFAMATGTGKTITALNCILNIYKESSDKIYHAIILVPTLTLVEQWFSEAMSFNFKEITKVSSHTNWESILATKISTAKRIPTAFIVICTYASFVKDKFQSIFKKLPEDTIFIADEGHNLASISVLSKLKNINLQKRIGLSATPKRIYDEEGTQAMESFFNDREPYTFSYSMEKAIKDNILCQYYYYPSIIKLMDEELNEYVEISNRLVKLYRMNKNNENNTLIEHLLLARKRIIHKARNKLSTTIEILKNNFLEKGNVKYTFVYVPEGESFEIDEDSETDETNIRLINQYNREIGKIDENILVNQFISGMKDRDEILRQFQAGAIDVITSMKCLDEGIDIPRAENAIFCSSTGNPRQFIQRRGRILRKHPNKRFANIYDLVVIPDYENQSEGNDTYELEKKMVKKELERVMYFASLSKNPYYTDKVFDDVCKHYNLNIYSIQNELRTI